MYRIVFALCLTALFATSQAQTTDSSNYTRNSAQTLIDSKSGNLLMAAYGEVHYNQAYASNTALNGKLDVHREVLLFGYRFDSKTTFISEIEIEHIKEVYLEQAFLNYQAKPWLNVQAGLLLIPMGIVNEYHEPTTFNGVERPTIDNVLVPTTWREIGAGFTGNLPGSSLRYQIFAVNGPLSYDGEPRLSGSKPIRSARQKGAEAVMRAPDLSTKINYYGIKGLNIGLAGYFGTTESSLFKNMSLDSTANMNQADSSVVGIKMVGLDYRYQIKNFETRGQFIAGSFSNTRKYNGFAGTDLGNKVFGYYIEGGYNIAGLLKIKKKLVPFVRYSAYDTHYEVGKEMAANKAYQSTILTTGLTYYLSSAFVAKIDHQHTVNGNNKTTNQFNAGVGFWFR